MKKLFLFTILLTLPLFAQEAKKAVPEGPAKVVSLTEDQVAKLDALQMQYENLRVQMENTQLKYTLRIREFKELLKLGPEYTWDDQNKKFVLQEKKP